MIKFTPTRAPVRIPDLWFGLFFPDPVHDRIRNPDKWQRIRPAKVEEKGPFIHQLQLFLVGGQQFTINELSDSPKMPQNVIAFINAWRQKRDVWHSPNNDPKFGVRVKDVSLYEYRVGRPAEVKPQAAAEAPKAAKGETTTKKAASKKADK